MTQLHIWTAAVFWDYGTLLQDPGKYTTCIPDFTRIACQDLEMLKDYHRLETIHVSSVTRERSPVTVAMALVAPWLSTQEECLVRARVMTQHLHGWAHVLFKMFRLLGRWRRHILQQEIIYYSYFDPVIKKPNLSAKIRYLLLTKIGYYSFQLYALQIVVLYKENFAHNTACWSWPKNFYASPSPRHLSNHYHTLWDAMDNNVQM